MLWPDLYYCVIEACNVPSLENARFSTRYGTETRKRSVSRRREQYCLAQNNRPSRYFEILCVVANVQFLRSRREMDGFEIS